MYLFLPGFRTLRAPARARFGMVLAGFGALSLTLAPMSTEAQRRTAAAEEETTAAVTLSDVPELSAQLESDDPQRVREAVELLSVVDDPAVIPPLATLLRSGRADAVVDRALDAIGVLASPAAIEVLSEFINHRRVGARRRAYAGLAAIEDPRVRPLLERGLRDSDRTIRGAAARALGELGDAESVPMLFRALERRVPEAAAAIGRLGSVEDLERFAGFQNSEPISVMLSGYEQFLRRSNFPIDAKRSIVERLQDIGTRPARQVLVEYESTFPERIRNTALRRLHAMIVSVIPTIAPSGASTTAPQGGAQ